MTQSPRTLARAAAAGALLLGTMLAGRAETTELKYKTYRDWEIVLPEESFQRVSGDIHFPDISPIRFSVRPDGAGLQIDRDGDGEMDSRLEGDGGVVTLRGKTAEGDKFLYALRLKKAVGGWVYAASGAALGTVNGGKIRFIDQNQNGRYDEWGVDAMITGVGTHATFLSKMVNIGDKLYSIDISTDGRQLTWEPFAGETGTLDLSSEFATKGKVLSVIVRNEDGTVSFNLNRGPTTVPSGTYYLDHGRIGLGRNLVSFSKGDTMPMAVRPGGIATVALGEPLTIDFRYARQAGRVIMAPQLLRYVGRAGEVYEPWLPFGESPEFDIRDAATGNRIALAIFGGT